MLRSFPLAVLLAASACVSAWADGVHLNGVSTRSIGRGGTNLGHADNAAILFDNPAGAVFIEPSQLFELGGGVLLTDMRYADADNPTTRDVNAVPIPQFGAVVRGEEGLWAVGVGVFTPAGFGQTFTLEGPPPFTGEQLYKSWGSLTKIVPAAAVKLTDRLSIGGTIGVAVSHAELEGPYTLQNAGVLTGLPTLIDVQATGAAPIFSVGLQYRLSDATTVGLAYQSESRFHLDGNAAVALPGLGPLRFDADVDVTYPRTLGLGVRHQLDRQRVVSADVVWFNWSAAFDDFGITLTQAPLPSLHELFPLAWRDSVSVRVGYEQTLREVHTLRGGYVYHRNPIPDDTLTPYIPATLEHGFSAGYGRRWGDWDIDLAYMFLFGPEVFVDTGLTGGDFDESTHKAYAHFLGVNAIYRY
uniref:Transporter n=1 Tax=Schlesneria paludicola TaxID=360056 RepID=A0A7C4QNT1_9PLAN